MTQKTSGKYIQLSAASADTPVYSIGEIGANLGVFALAILAQPSLSQSRFVLAYTEETTVGGLLETWSKVTGNKSAFVQAASVEELDNIWPAWGGEMGIMMAFWGHAMDKSWTGEDIITGKELGVKGLVGIEAAYKAMDWKAVL